jgi:hypothetical protein
VPLATVNAVQTTTWPSREPSDPSGLEPDGYSLASLVLSTLAASHEVQPLSPYRVNKHRRSTRLG